MIESPSVPEAKYDVDISFSFAKSDDDADFALGLRRRQRVFEWRQKGWSRCSKECGGGGRQRMTLRYSFWFPCPVHM
jgi:hypothetical protein